MCKRQSLSPFTISSSKNCYLCGNWDYSQDAFSENSNAPSNGLYSFESSDYLPQKVGSYGPVVTCIISHRSNFGSKRESCFEILITAFYQIYNVEEVL